MLNENRRSSLAAALGRSLGDVTFMPLDVGASGGISPVWNQFGERLRAHGFDPLIAEVGRLNGVETTGRVRYHSVFISCPDATVEGLKTENVLSTLSFQLTSAMRAAKAMATDYVREQFNAGAAVEYTERRITIDEFCAEQQIRVVDFIKTDTDGHDYYALKSARETLTGRGVLGVMCECNLHGAPHPHVNTFGNIDRFLRECGLALFDMDVWRYTRGALPGRFYYDLPAQTVTGPVQWRDALYLLDPLTRPGLFDTLARPQLVKLLMLYDIFGLPDCAAALMNEMRARGIAIPGLDYSSCLDRLVPTWYKPASYEGYVADFDRDPTAFYPSRQGSGGELVTMQTRDHASLSRGVRSLLARWRRRI